MKRADEDTASRRSLAPRRGWLGSLPAWLAAAVLLVSIAACGPPERDRIEAGEPEPEGQDLGWDDLGGADPADLGPVDLGEGEGADAGLAVDSGLPEVDGGGGGVDLGGPDDLGPQLEDLGSEEPDLWIEPPPEGTLELAFIDVGQGDSIFLRLSSGETILVDGGSQGAGNRAVVPFLRERNVEQLDLVVLTHPHEDHCGGLDEVIAAFPTLEVWESGERSDSGQYVEFQRARAASGARTLVPPQGLRRDLGELHLYVMNREEGRAGANDDSLVIQARFGQIEVLLTGDVTALEQRDLVGDFGNQLRSEVLKVPHHGSADFAPTFVSAVSPTWAVISVGLGNSYGHPAQSALAAYRQAGATICRTDQDGTVTGTSDGVDVVLDCLP